MSDAVISVIVGVVATSVLTLIAFLFKKYFDSATEKLMLLIQNSQAERNMQHTELKEDVIEIKTDVKDLNTKVEIQNGRVRGLESWKEYHQKEGEYLLKGFSKTIEEIQADIKPAKKTKRR